MFGHQRVLGISYPPLPYTSAPSPRLKVTSYSTVHYYSPKVVYICNTYVCIVYQIQNEPTRRFRTWSQGLVRRAAGLLFERF